MASVFTALETQMSWPELNVTSLCVPAFGASPFGAFGAKKAGPVPALPRGLFSPSGWFLGEAKNRAAPWWAAWCGGDGCWWEQGGKKLCGDEVPVPIPWPAGET